MLIGEVSKKYNVPIETLRYYEKIGLLVPGRRGKNRFYLEKDLKKLSYILKMKQMMFSLDETKHILAIDEKIDHGLTDKSIAKEDIADIHYQVQVKYDQILDKEKEIQLVKDHLKGILNKITELERSEFNE